MPSIKPFRLLFSGLVAGLLIIVGEYILNGVILASQWQDLRGDFGIATPGTLQLGVGGVLTLSYGLVLMWMYVAMRPRFGTSFKAALVAGFTFWFIAYALFLLSVWTNGFVTAEIAAISIGWGVLEAPLAAIVGAKAYGSGGAPEAEQR